MRQTISATAVVQGGFQMLPRPQSSYSDTDTSTSHFIDRHKQRPKTASILPDRNCHRITQSSEEPTAQLRFFNQFGVKRAKSAVTRRHQQPSASSSSNTELAPGCLLARTKAKVRVTIQDGFFEKRPKSSSAFSAGSGSAGSGRGQNMQPEIQSLIERLEFEVSDLSIRLEEERMNHRHSKQQAEEILKDKTCQLRDDHRSSIQKLEREQEEHFEELAQRHKEETADTQREAQAKIEKLHDEVSFLHGAFDSFKGQMTADSQHKLDEQKETLGEAHKEELTEQLDQLRIGLSKQHHAEKTKIESDHRKKADKARRENDRELEGYRLKYANHEEDLQSLRKATVELKDTKAELSELKEAHRRVTQEMITVKDEYTRMRGQVESFEKTLSEKIKNVEEAYKDKLDDLRRTNSDLRRMYVKKAEELFSQQTFMGNERDRQMVKAKDAMKILIEARHQSHLSIAARDPLNPASRTPEGQAAIAENSSKKNQFVRPSSAPDTRQERDIARITAGRATNTDELSKDTVIISSTRPNTGVAE